MVVAGVMQARTGTVLISRPTIVSAPGMSVGRPETAVPKATSCWPVSRISSCAHAACSTMLTVVWHERASSSTACVVSADNRNDSAPRGPMRRAGPGGPTRVGVSKPVELLLPGGGGGVEVTLGEPGDEAAVGDGAGSRCPP